MEQEGSTMRPADATSDETLADIDETDELDDTDDDVVSPDGDFDEDEELNDAEP